MILKAAYRNDFFERLVKPRILYLLKWYETSWASVASLSAADPTSGKSRIKRKLKWAQPNGLSTDRDSRRRTHPQNVWPFEQSKLVLYLGHKFTVTSGPAERLKHIEILSQEGYGNFDKFDHAWRRARRRIKEGWIVFQLRPHEHVKEPVAFPTKKLQSKR